MTDEKNCPHCGKPVPPTALGGICPECMLKAGLAAQTEGPHGTRVLQPPPAPAEIASLFPQLEILECLGRGGMGVVYKARQPRLNRLVALKILAREKQQEAQFTERFVREAQALARLNHPNIVTVHDFGEVGGHCYLVMEFVDGPNLRQLLQARKMPSEQALAIVPKICEALQYAHEQGIVHRDIKPENILLDKSGRVKIADFGIAKMMGDETGQQTLTGAKDAVGTPHYMAPEQIEKPLTVDHRADIYSLGVVFYEMLTGELPLGKFQPPSKKVQIDVRLDEVVLHALEKEPDQRYQHVSEVKTRLETIASSGAPITVPAVSAEEILARDFTLNIRNCLRRGWALVRNDFWPLVGMSAFVLVVLSAAPSSGVALSDGHSSGTISFLGILLGGPLMGGLYLYFLKKIRREAAGVETAFTGFRQPFPHLVIASLLATLLTGLGFLCLIMPGIYLFVAWIFTFPLIVDRRLDFWPAMRLSRKIISKHWWKFLEFLIVLGLINLAGILACGVGLLITFPITLAALMYAYEDIFSPAAGVAGNQPAGAPAAPPRPGGGWGTAVGVAVGVAAAVVFIAFLGLLAAVAIPNFIRARQHALALHEQQVAAKSDYIGQAWFPQGDSIEIISVERTKNQMAVKGHYHLVSHDQASLALYITSTNQSGFPEGAFQTMTVLKGRGNFELIHPGVTPGLPHVSMYAGGHPFASLYFGTTAEAREESQAGWITNAQPDLGPVIEKVTIQTNAAFLVGQTGGGGKLALTVGFGGLSWSNELKANMVFGAVIRPDRDELCFDVSSGTGPASFTIQNRIALTPVGRIPRGRLIFHEGTYGPTIENIVIADLITETGEILPVCISVQKSEAISSPASSFGPVVERVVPDQDWFDLDSGTIIPASVIPDHAEEIVEEYSIHKAGADFRASVSDRSLLAPGCGLLAWSEQGIQWESATPETVADLISKARADKIIETTRIRPTDKPPATWAFCTREGTLGLLQITGFTENPRGVKIRYQLVQSVPAKGTETLTTQNLHFDSVMEQTLADDTAIDLASGRQTALPESATRPDSGTNIDDAICAWMRRRNVDFVFSKTGWVYGMTLNMVTLKRDSWDHCNPQQLAESLRGESSDLRVKFGYNNPTGYTFGFKNRDGTLGLLQITGFTEHPSGVQVRYKLVQATDSKALLASPALEPADLREARARLAELAVDYSPQHPVYLRQQARIQALEREGKEHPDEPADLRGARAELAELRVDYSEYYPAVQKALARVKELERMTKEEPNASPVLREAKAHLAELRVDFSEYHPLIQKALAEVKVLEQSNAATTNSTRP